MVQFQMDTIAIFFLFFFLFVDFEAKVDLNIACVGCGGLIKGLNQAKVHLVTLILANHKGWFLSRFDIVSSHRWKFR
jgi:hypothetical protein